MEIVESIGSKELGEVVEGQLRFPLVVRLPESYRQSPETIGAIQLSTPSGQRIPLSSVARVEQVEGPSTITREWGQRRTTVSVNVRGRDVGKLRRRGSAERSPIKCTFRPVATGSTGGGQFEESSTCSHSPDDRLYRSCF
jgi:cobalt-zinc-cadmium resistance protein CzcA